MKWSFKVLVIKCSQGDREWYELMIKHYFFGLCYETNSFDRVYDTSAAACEVASRYRDYVLSKYYRKTVKHVCNEFNSDRVPADWI
jgi:hypothetical protein